MATVINVTAGSQAILFLGSSTATATPGDADELKIPFMQDITVNASTGVTRYKVLDSASEKAFTTPSTNQISVNALVDSESMWGAGTGANTVKTAGLFDTSNSKTKVYFTVVFEGADSSETKLTGEGFISGLAPTASMDQAVWISPITIEVDGNFTKGTI